MSFNKRELYMTTDAENEWYYTVGTIKYVAKNKAEKINNYFQLNSIENFSTTIDKNKNNLFVKNKKNNKTREAKLLSLDCEFVVKNSCSKADAVIIGFLTQISLDSKVVKIFVHLGNENAHAGNIVGYEFPTENK